MEKIQEQSDKGKKYFILGVVLIILSSAIGWILVAVCALLSAKYGIYWIKIGAILYALSWIPFGLGFLLAGKEGVVFAKRFFKRIFK